MSRQSSDFHSLPNSFGEEKNCQKIFFFVLVHHLTAIIVNVRYVLERFVHCLLGRSHLDLPEEEKRRIRLEKGEHVDPNQEVFKLGEEGNAIVVPKEHVHLTQVSFGVGNRPAQLDQ